MFAEPWQTVLQPLQTEHSFNPQTAMTVSLWTEAKTGPNKQSAESHMMVNDRGRTRSQVKGEARKREVRKVRVGSWGYVLALSRKSLSRQGPIPAPPLSLDSEPRRGSLLLRTHSPCSPDLTECDTQGLNKLEGPAADRCSPVPQAWPIPSQRKVQRQLEPDRPLPMTASGLPMSRRFRTGASAWPYISLAMPPSVTPPTLAHPHFHTSPIIAKCSVNCT